MAESSAEGPVLSVVSKRIRALRKKLNRIAQMEEALAAGKTLNREQEEVLRSKPVVAVLIEELEKLRPPLAAALLLEEKEPSSIPISTQGKRGEHDAASQIADLVRLLYFASLFDVRPQTEFTATMLTRSHERGCCLTYDYVTDDDKDLDLLSDKDLDLLSDLGSLVTSRPADHLVSHKAALDACIAHATRWIAAADHPIHAHATATCT